MLKRKYVVPGERPLIDFDHMYKYQKVISFIGIEDSGITNSGITYLSKYPGSFSNVSICPVTFPLVMSRFFVSVNEFEPHNKHSQSNLALENF